MKLALISDIHSNLEALDAVLDDIRTREIDKICCLGDVIGYGSDPGACLEKVVESCEIRLMGNHEFAALGLQSLNDLNTVARESIDWTTSVLTDHEISIMAEFDIDATLEDCYLVHSSPSKPDAWHYLLTTHEAEQGFEHMEYRIGFVGHTHLPMVFSQSSDGLIRHRAGHDFDPDEETRYLVNVGSVGQPRDGDPRACYVIYDSRAVAVSYHRVAYDVQKTQKKMSQAKLPSMLIDRLGVGR